MRFPVAAAALIVLAACSDRALTLPTATRGTKASQTSDPVGQAGRPVDGTPMLPYDSTSLDGVPVLTRIETMMGASLAPVPIPADGFSHATDAVHPDIACSPDVWHGSRCWVTYTPYLNSDATVENPSFLSATTETKWQTPVGVSNPVIPSPGGVMYNSDPDQVFDPATNRLVTFYREVANGYNKIYVTTTQDARTWSVPQLAFMEQNHNAVSPTVVLEANRTASMWYVQSGLGCTASATSVRMRTTKLAANQPLETAVWSDAVDVQMSQPGFAIWHMDVMELPDGGYVAFFAAHAPTTDCASDDLWLATSDDGMHWHSFAVPVLWRGMKAAKTLGISTWYRGTMRYDALTDTLHLWPSALTASGKWVVYHTTVKYSELLRALMIAVPADQPTMQLRTASRVSAAIRRHMP